MKQCVIQPRVYPIKLPETARFFGLEQDYFQDAVWRSNCEDTLVLPEAVCTELHQAQCDFAILTPQKFADIGLIVSDMDSTLITIECIDEIAAQAGLKNQISEITERAMRGELDFTQSLLERVALLKGLPEQALEKVYQQSVQLSEGAEQLLSECKKYGVKFMLVSGGFTFFTDRLQQRLGLDWAYANRLEVDEQGCLTGKVLGKIIDAQAKAELLKQHREELGLQKEQVVAIGDGANDIPMLEEAGIGIAYHAKPKTQAAADCCIHYGGLNALRNWFE